jgi:hypothetical protein
VRTDYIGPQALAGGGIQVPVNIIKIFQAEVIKPTFTWYRLSQRLCCYFISYLITKSVHSNWLPLWSSGRVPSYRSRGPRFDSQHYQIFWEAVGLERGPPRLVSTTEELLATKSSSSGLEIREYGCRDPSRWPHGALYTQNLALTLPASGSRSVGIVCSQTKATSCIFFLCSNSFVWFEVLIALLYGYTATVS